MNLITEDGRETTFAEEAIANADVQHIGDFIRQDMRITGNSREVAEAAVRERVSERLREFPTEMDDAQLARYWAAIAQQKAP